MRVLDLVNDAVRVEVHGDLDRALKRMRQPAALLRSELSRRRHFMTPRQQRQLKARRARRRRPE
jgi:ribosomal protein S21